MQANVLICSQKKHSRLRSVTKRFTHYFVYNEVVDSFDSEDVLLPEANDQKQRTMKET